MPYGCSNGHIIQSSIQLNKIVSYIFNQSQAKIQNILQLQQKQFNISNQMISPSTKSQSFDQVLKESLKHLKDNQKYDIFGDVIKHNYFKSKSYESKDFTWFSQNSDVMTFTQSEYSLNYAFSKNSFQFEGNVRQKVGNFKNQITIYTFLKQTGEHQCKKLKPIYKSISSLCFSFDKQLSQAHPLYLLCGASNGILCVVAFHQSKIQLKQFQCSYFELTKIVQGIWPQTSFVLCKDQTVLLVNYLTKSILMQTKGALLPLDSPLDMKISYDDNYILQSSTYGTIRLWKFGQQIISAIQKSGKAFVSKPFLTISSLSLNGLKWCDFLGDFLVLITSQSILKIVAISHNNSGQAEQNFEILTQLQLLSNEKQQILDADCNPFKRLITVSKRKLKQFFVQTYLFNEQYEIVSLAKIQFPQFKNKIFPNMSISEEMTFICLRDKSGFAIGHDEQMFNQIVEDTFDCMSQSTKEYY